MSGPNAPVWLLLGLILLLPSHAGAAPPDVFDPASLAEPANDYKGWQVTGFRLRARATDQGQGEHPKLEDTLLDRIRSGLALSGDKKFLGTDYPLLYPKTLETDLERINLSLSRAGYPYADLEVKIEPESKQRKLRLTVSISPGRPVLVRALETEGFPEAMRPHPNLRQLAGQRLQDDFVESDLSDLRRQLRELGHARARVQSQILRVDDTTVDLTYRAFPGPSFLVGNVQVEGAPDDLVTLVKTTMAAPRGEVFRPSLLDRGQTRLRQLDLFRQIRFDTRREGEGREGEGREHGDEDNRDQAPPHMNIRIELVPRSMRTFEIGLGYWTDDLAQVQARWKHRNLLGKGRGLEVRGSASRFIQEAGVLAWVPKFLGPRTKASLSAERSRNDEDSYTLIENTAEFAAVYNPTLDASLRAAVSLSYVELDVSADNLDDFQEGGGLQTVFSALARRDTANDRFYPTSGFVSWIRGDWAPTIQLANAPFVLGESYLSAYFTPIGSLIWASRGSFGLARPVDGALDLLPNYRFFAGGSNSMRGFKRRRLGPLDADGDPLGGEAKAELATELRFPLFWILRGAIFADAGQVWRQRSDIAIADLELATGAGLMLLSPVGPIRVDYGYRVTDVIEDQPKSVLHISIGQPF